MVVVGSVLAAFCRWEKTGIGICLHLRHFPGFVRRVKRRTHELNRNDMITETKMPPAANLRRPRANHNIAPSLRLAVTAKNRALLRWLRAAELSAWQEAETRRPVSSRALRAKTQIQPLFHLYNR
jgi:hypothetical protein